MTFWTPAGKYVFPKRSAKMIDGSEKPKIPSKFAKRTARYNEFRYKCYELIQKYLVGQLISWLVC